MRPEAGSPEDWLRHARSDLALARSRASEEVLLESLCFHAQQAAEKAIKAMLVGHGAQVPRTHSLRMLVDQLAQLMPVPDAVEACVELTAYGVAARYPGDEEPVEPAEYEQAVALAAQVVAWAQTHVEGLERGT